MSNIIKTIKVEEGHGLELERRFYDMKGLEQLVNLFTSNNEMAVNKEKYLILLKEYQEAFTAYNILWNQLIEIYVDVDDRIYNADYNFQDQLFTLRNA